MLGEAALFGERKYPATAVAAEPLVCRRLDREHVTALIRTDDEAAWFFLGRLADRLTGVIGRLDDLGSMGISTRLARHLINRVTTTGSTVISLGMTQRELAEELGTVREVVVRELRHMVSAGLVASSGRGLYRVIDSRALEMLARR